MPVSSFTGGEVFRAGVSLGRVNRVMRGGAEIWTRPAAPNAGVGTDTPIMLVGNSLPIGMSTMWWGGPDGTAEGGYSHTVADGFRADYAGPISRGLGNGTQIGPQITTRMLWDRPEGEWAANNDPRRDLSLYAGGAMLMFEGYSVGAAQVSQPYYDWTGNDHRTALLQDLEYGLNFIRAAVQAGVAPYLGGAWPRLGVLADDAAWRAQIPAYDEAMRYRRDVLRAQLLAEGLAGDLWIVPLHLMFARFYDDGLAGQLPAGVTSHRDFHALDVNHDGGRHPYMLNPLSAYCAWCMTREVVMGADASTMPAHPADGVTESLAAYLRGVAVDIARSYAPAGRGGVLHADPGYIAPVAVAPQTALGSSFAAQIIGGVGTVSATAGPLDFGALLIEVDDLSGLTNSAAEVLLITGPDGRFTRVEIWDWGGGPNLDVRFFDASWGALGGVQMSLPATGSYLFEWRNTPGGIVMRRVDLDALPTSAAKVTSVTAWPQEYAAGLPGAATIVASAQPYLTLHAAWAGTAIPDAAQMVALNAWIDELTGLTAWDGVFSPLDMSRVSRVVVIGASIMNMLAGSNLATRHWESTQALANGMDVFGSSTAGEAMAAQIDNVAAALAAFPEVGETVFLLHTGGNDITPRVPFSAASAADLDLMRDRLNAVLDAFGAHLPYVIAMPPSFRSYTAQGFGPRELYNDQMEGSLGFNEAVFKPIYRDRINPRWRYGDGESIVCFYDQVRNGFEDWLTDGIHIGWTSARRTAILSRVAAAIAGNRPARVDPDPVDPAAPAFTSPARILPASGPVGTIFTLSQGAVTGDAPIAISGVLTLDGVDVTSGIEDGEYTSTAAGPLVWTVTATNASGADTSTASATVAAGPAELAAYISYTDTPSGVAGLNELPNGYANSRTDTNGPIANLVDAAGEALGWTYQARSPTTSPMAGVGINPGTIAGDGTVEAFNGSTILATQVLAASLYSPSNQSVIHAIGGLIPGGSYELRFVGTRLGSAGRVSRFTEPGGTYVEVDPSLTPSTSNAPSPPLTAVADAGGFVLITQSASAGGFSYLGGFSVQQAPI